MAQQSPVPIGRDRSVAQRDLNPFANLQRQIDRIFDDFWRMPLASDWMPSPNLVPSMDVKETEKEIEISAELPGLEEKDVQINLADNVLTIRGEKKGESEKKEHDYRLLERSYGSFSRSLTLPNGINPDEIKATMSKGVLKLTIPKPAPAVAKKIEVKPAA